MGTTASSVTTLTCRHGRVFGGLLLPVDPVAMAEFLKDAPAIFGTQVDAEPYLFNLILESCTECDEVRDSE